MQTAEISRQDTFVDEGGVGMTTEPLPADAGDSTQVVEETKQGLNIENVDQDGRSMFPEGGKEPYERTRKLLQKIAP